MKPLISFCIPTYNRAATVFEAVTSILACGNGYIQVVVSDNGSIDDTKKLLCQVKDNRFKYVRNDYNMGFAYNLFNTFHNADGEFLFALSDEDRIINEKIEELIFLLQKNSNVGFILDQIKQFPKQSIIPTKTYILDTFLNRDVGLAEYGEFRFKTYVSGYIYNKKFLDLEKCFQELLEPESEFMSVFPQIYAGLMVAHQHGFINVSIRAWERKENLASNFFACYEIHNLTKGFCRMISLFCQKFENQAFLMNVLEANYLLYQSMILSLPSFFMAHTDNKMNESFFDYLNNINYFALETKKVLETHVEDAGLKNYLQYVIDAKLQEITPDIYDMLNKEAKFKKFFLERENPGDDIFLYGTNKDLSFFLSELKRLILFDLQPWNPQIHLFDLHKSKYSPESELMFEIPEEDNVKGKEIIVFSDDFLVIKDMLANLGANCIWYKGIT